MSLNLEQANAINANYQSGLVAASTTAGNIKTVTNRIVYSINGIIYGKDATDDAGFGATAGTALAIGRACAFAFWIDSAAATTCTQGAIVSQGEGCPMPPPQPNKCCFAVVKVHLCTAVFTPGTTALGTGNTAVYYNCSTLPGSAL